MSVAFVLLRCIGKAVVKNVVNLLSFGVGGDILIDAWEEWREASKEERRPADVQALAAAPPAEVAAAAAEVVRQEGGNLSDAEKQAVTEYLRQVPPMIRRSQRRTADPDGKTVRPGAAFRRPEDLAPLLPPGAALQGGRSAADRRRLGTGRIARPRRFRRGVEGEESAFRRRGAGGAEVLPRSRRKGAVVAARSGDPQSGHAPGPPRRHRAAAAHLPDADPPCLAYEYVAGGDLTGLIQDTAPSGEMTPIQAARSSRASLRSSASLTG